MKRQLKYLLVAGLAVLVVSLISIWVFDEKIRYAEAVILIYLLDVRFNLED